VTLELVVLYRRTEGFAFKEPGQHWVSAKIVAVNPAGGNPRNYDIAAEPVAITVREPAGRERATWEWLQIHKDEYGRLVQVPWEAELSEEFVNGCHELCDTSDSVYVEYLALFLSRWYGEGQGKNPAEAAKFAEIARARASSEMVRDLASKTLVRATEAVAAAKRQSEAAQAREEPPELPVAPELQAEFEALFQEYIAAMRTGDIDRCLELLAEDHRGWSRARQREELQEDIDKMENPRRRGITVHLSARVLSVVGRGDDVVVTARLTYREGPKPPQENTVRCLLRKYGDQWLLQDWSSVSQDK
jgi:ketosteroid isomerase-like protein